LRSMGPAGRLLPSSISHIRMGCGRAEARPYDKKSQGACAAPFCFAGSHSLQSMGPAGRLLPSSISHIRMGCGRAEARPYDKKPSPESTRSLCVLCASAVNNAGLFDAPPPAWYVMIRSPKSEVRSPKSEVRTLHTGYGIRNSNDHLDHL
jgi:hypothetical protein